MNANELYCKNRTEWRSWLKKNHTKCHEIWLIYYKKHTGKARIPYDDAVEEALCYGWIDSIVRTIDEETYKQKFTPRKDKSSWSDLNKKRVEKLVQKKRMTKAGMEKVTAAKNNGCWDKKVPVKSISVEADILASALKKNKEAYSFFKSLAPSYQKQYILWINGAKKKKPEKNASRKLLHY